MLETEEVDDDYFTPVASASLANIFGKSVTDEKSDNDSLKYTPPKAQNVNKQPEDSKTSCVFACALEAYEWHNNVYLPKGKVGFALIKVIKTGTHNIILYDSNKTRLSYSNVTGKSRFTLKSNNYISYYDDQKKYWSLYGAEIEIKTILELLKSLDVTIDTSTETNINPPESIINKELQSIQEDSKKHNIESDTDSVIHRKTKASILNRMANMGHSVLPSKDISAEKNSDSSDTNDTDFDIKAVRHKPVKGSMKRSSIDKTLLDHPKIIDMQLNVETARMGHITEIKNNSSLISGQLVPLANTIVNSCSGIEMNTFITEQRISNSELRINMGRINDKADYIINKINKLELKEQNKETENINTEILHKLLKEYEGKIKVYEELIQKMGTDKNSQSVSPNIEVNHKNEETFNKKIYELENAIKERDEIVIKLQNEVQILKDTKEKQSNVLQMNASELEAELTNNKILLNKVTEENMKLTEINSDNNIESKIKSLMNDTYQAVATNFDNGKTYSGESIKKTIAMVIKKVTLSALNDS